ncbi:hypothetical protein TNCV_3071011 [Trichonephila clavipes]|nr:hypothetical protein TNCV_3071011 [Trichonephila clavipes]
MGGCGWCLESVVDISWGRVSLIFHPGFGSIANMVSLGGNFFFLVGSMEPQHSSLTGTPRRSPNFLLIVDNFGWLPH